MRKSFMAVLLMAASCGVSAGTVICAGTVETLSYHASGSFMLKLSSMNKPVFFCNPDTEWVVPGTTYKTGPNACKMIYSTLLSAKATGQPITNMYFDGDAAPAACNEWGDWKSVNIRHYLY